MSLKKNGDRRYNLFQIFQQIHNKKFQVPKHLLYDDNGTIRDHTKRLKRLKGLAMPRVRPVHQHAEWSLTPALKCYKPTQRIQQLSQPVQRGIGRNYQKYTRKVSPKALKYNPSERILQLAIPAERLPENSDRRIDPFSVATRALRARPTRRIAELAKPKENKKERRKTKSNPFSVPKSALRAKPSLRILELAQPRGSMTSAHSNLSEQWWRGRR